MNQIDSQHLDILYSFHIKEKKEVIDTVLVNKLLLAGTDPVKKLFLTGTRFKCP